jgi:peptidoglycan/xylan/chitin deacetylase (PgdA/CDA1 family)
MPEETFVGYLSYLEDDGWPVIDLETLLRGLTAPDELPARAVLLTFDDGYRSNLEVALPWLRRFGYPGVIFVPTSYIGGRNAFDADALIEPEEAICDWSELRELTRHGISVQSHGVSHRRFSQLSQAEQDQELLRSKTVLEDGLGKSVEVFSFPYGDDGADPRIVARLLARSGYRAACLYGGGPNHVPVRNQYRLSRIAMGADTDLRVALGGLDGSE